MKLDIWRSLEYTSSVLLIGLPFPFYFDLGPGSTLNVKDEEYSTSSTPPAHDGPASGLYKGITVGISVEFSYEELATATDNFSLANKIGKGGSGSVYYAELRGEVITLVKLHINYTWKF